MHRIGRTGRAGRGGTAITLAEPREHRLLRTIENFTKQKIEVATVPTVADLRARRLDITRASLRERLLAGDLDHVRVVVESLAQEFDIVDIAAAAVKLAHAAAGGNGEEREIPVVQAPPTGAAARTRPLKPARGRVGRPRRTARSVSTPAATAMLPGCSSAPGGGQASGPATWSARSPARPASSRATLGAIEIADGFSLVEVPEELADEIIAALRATKIRGLRPTVRRDRG